MTCADFRKRKQVDEPPLACNVCPDCISFHCARQVLVEWAETATRGFLSLGGVARYHPRLKVQFEDLTTPPWVGTITLMHMLYAKRILLYFRVSQECAERGDHIGESYMQG